MCLELIKSLNEQDYPKELYDVYVIADNCTDKTEKIARTMGANVFVRTEEDPKKKKTSSSSSSSGKKKTSKKEEEEDPMADLASVLLSSLLGGK